MQHKPNDCHLNVSLKGCDETGLSFMFILFFLLYIYIFFYISNLFLQQHLFGFLNLPSKYYYYFLKKSPVGHDLQINSYF